MTIGGVLSGKQIEELNLIDGFDSQFVRPTSYNLRLGNEFFLCGTGDPADQNYKLLSDQGAITIRPFHSVIFSTIERINLQKDINGRVKNVVGRFDLKIQYGLGGFILQVGTQIEPGYFGPLFGLLLNTSADNKSLYVGDSLLQLEFSYLSTEDPSEIYLENTVKNIHDFLQEKHISIDIASHQNIINSVEAKLKTCRDEHNISDTQTALLATVGSNRKAAEGNRIQKIAIVISLTITILLCIFENFIKG